MTTFSRFPPRLQQAIASRLGWTSLRPVQELAGAAIMAGQNTLVLAPTAGGKTEAAVFPVLADLVEHPTDTVGALYVAPIKALLNNQEERLGAYCEMVGLRGFVWHGDATPAARRAFAEEPTELLLTTPESLEVMLLSSWVPVARLFHDLRFAIVDEVHAMAGTDRGAHLMSVLERLARFTANDIQRVGLSATVGNPGQILAWLAGSSAREGVVVQPPVAPSPRALAVLLREDLAAIARAAAHAARDKKSLLFCPSRALTEGIAERLQDQGTDVFVHHSSVSFEARQAAEERFHGASNACIVCTSTLELGIDVGDLDLVLQANAPSTVSSFLQRMGRTGRRPGQVANTTFLCESADTVLQAVALVELGRERWVEPVEPHARCWPVLVHQILAMTLQLGGVTAGAMWDQLARVPDFSGIARSELDALLAHMLAEGYLFLAEGRYSMGDEAERVFGRKNFMDMYSVFSTPQLYRVLTTTMQEVGSLEQGFVDQLVEEMSSFLLGGRAWAVEQVSHADRTVRVSVAPTGKKPLWGGFIPQLLSRKVCEKVRHVLTSRDDYPFLDPEARCALQERRADLGDLLRAAGTTLRVDEDGAHWWTFAGGRVNHTLKYALEWLTGAKVVVDNFQLRISDTSPADIAHAVATISKPGFWGTRETRQALTTRLPPYRLSKFQRALPEHLQAEMVAAYLLDVPGAVGWLAREEAGADRAMRSVRGSGP